MIFVWRDFHDICEDAGASGYKEESNEEDIDIGLEHASRKCGGYDESCVDGAMEHHSLLSSVDIRPVSKQG
jgi:hypothetical protein